MSSLLTTFRRGICALAFAVGVPQAGAFVVYQDNFDGPAATAIHGQALDVNTYDPLATWTAAPIFQADGTVTYAATADEGGLTLPFEPQDGATYTLTAVVNNPGPGWVAFGFSQNPTTTINSSNNRHSNNMTGYLWGLVRNNSTSSSEDQQFHRGSTTNNKLTVASGDLVPYAGNFELKLVLNTLAASAWQYEVFYDGVSQGGVQVLDPATSATLRSNINYVGFSKDTAGSGDTPAKLVSFLLETSLLPGDVTGDGLVNAADLLVIKNNLFTTGVTRSAGDLTGDGAVNFVDFRQWKQNAGPAFAAYTLASVPEPAASALAAGLLLTVGLSRAGIARNSCDLLRTSHYSGSRTL